MINLGDEVVVTFKAKVFKLERFQGVDLISLERTVAGDNDSRVYVSATVLEQDIVKERE